MQKGFQRGRGRIEGKPRTWESQEPREKDALRGRREEEAGGLDQGKLSRMTVVRVELDYHGLKSEREVDLVVCTDNSFEKFRCEQERGNGEVAGGG